jgi:hypothetical protein
MKRTERLMFEEEYRVVAVEGGRLLLRGVRSGRVLTITNPESAPPIKEEDYPPGKLITISDPSAEPQN